jgi:hypothetical protein
MSKTTFPYCDYVTHSVQRRHIVTSIVTLKNVLAYISVSNETYSVILNKSEEYVVFTGFINFE